MGRHAAALHRTPLVRGIEWTSAPLRIPIAVASGYYLGCLAGFALRFPSSGISFFWPPTAILAAALLLTAPGSWTAILVASFIAHAIAHAQDGVPVAAWPIQFLGNAAQAIIAAVVVRRLSGNADIFADARRVLIFIGGACVVAPAVASLIPAYVYVSLNWAPDFAEAWRNRTVSNLSASLTLLPTLVVLCQYFQTAPVTLPKRLPEYLLLLGGALGAQLTVTFVQHSGALGMATALYAPVPFLVWATARFGGTGLSVALLWTSLLTIWSAWTGVGPLATGSPSDRVVGVQLVIGANAVLMMLIAGLVEQNRREHRVLVDVEQQNSAILRAIPDWMFLQTRDGVCVGSYARRFDAPQNAAESLVGQNVSRLLPPEVAVRFASMLQTATPEAPSVLEYTQVVHGEPRRFEGRFIAVDDDRVLSVIRDITERWRSENALREAQQHYALATAAGGVGVWEIDVQQQTVRIEGTLNALLGYGERQIDRLDDWLALIHPADVDDVRGRLTRMMTGVRPNFDAELRMVRRDGSIAWIASSGAVTDRVGDTPTHVRGTYTDVTERKNAARALAEANDALARTGRIAAMAEFSASIAHELTQPLASIVANASASIRSLNAPSPTVDLEAALNDVAADARRATEIVERTRDMFGNRRAAKEAVNLNDLIRRIAGIADARLRRASVSLSLSLDDQMPDVVADPVQIQQVLLNLVVNAIEALEEVPADARTLTIRSLCAKSVAVVSVRDNGRGFDSEDPRRMFDSFYTTKASGVGVGLSICRSIVDGHGGSLWAVANRDRGTTFRFTLPLPSPRTGRRPPAAAHARRVLIVDDHQELRRSLTRLVRGLGHHVASAGSGARALQAAKTFQPEYAIVDVSLLDMTGIELARRLRAEFADLRLIALTAHRDADVCEACLNNGFEAFLIKPDGFRSLERLLGVANTAS